MDSNSEIWVAALCLTHFFFPWKDISTNTMVLEVTTSPVCKGVGVESRANSCDTAGTIAVSNTSETAVPDKGADNGIDDAGAGTATDCTGSDCAEALPAEFTAETAFSFCDACLMSASCSARGSRISVEACLSSKECSADAVSCTGVGRPAGEVRLIDEVCFAGDACLDGEASLVGERCRDGEACCAAADLAGESPLGDAGFPADDHECAEVPERGGAEVSP